MVGIYAALAGKGRQDVLAEFGGRQFSEFKPVLADLAVEVLSPISARMRELLADPAGIDATLRDGAGRAREIATATIAETKAIMGLIDN